VERGGAQLIFSFGHVTFVTCYSRYSEDDASGVAGVPATLTQNVSSASRLSARTQSLTTIALLVLLQVPWRGWLFPGDGLLLQIVRELMFWIMAALLIVYVLRIEQRSLSSIGAMKPNWSTVAFGVGGAALMIAGIAFIYLLVFPALGVPEEKQLNE